MFREVGRAGEVDEDIVVDTIEAPRGFASVEVGIEVDLRAVLFLGIETSSQGVRAIVLWSGTLTLRVKT